MKRLLLALLLALVAATDAQNACPRLTGKTGCGECRKRTCLYCTKGFGEVWTGTGASLQVSQCVAGAPTRCNGQQGYCARCVPAPGNPPTCIECKTTATTITQPAPLPRVAVQRYTHKLSWQGASFGKCVTVAGGQAAVAAFATGNPSCAAWNADNTCKLCRNWWQAAASMQALVVPINALFTNGVNPLSTCRTRAQIATLSRSAVGQDMTASPWLPRDCTEVTTSFRCARCKPGQSLAFNARRTAYLCKPRTAAQYNTRPRRAANGCIETLAFQEYCMQCNPAGTLCLTNQCTPGRSPAPAGYCSLNCKQLFGITCLACNANRCLSTDAAFPNGRR